MHLGRTRSRGFHLVIAAAPGPSFDPWALTNGSGSVLDSIAFVGRPKMTEKLLGSIPPFADPDAGRSTWSLASTAGQFPIEPPAAGSFAPVLAAGLGPGWAAALEAATDDARARGVQLVCAEDPYLSGWMGVELKHRLRVPLQVTIHYASLSLDMGAHTPRGRYWRRTADWVLSEADSIRTVNLRLARRLQRQYPHIPVYFVPLPVDLDAFDGPRRPRARPTVVSVARLSPEKGLHLFLACLPALVRRHPDIEILIAGDGQLRPALTAAIDAMGAADHIRLLGQTDPAALRDLLAEAHVFALPSASEGWGLATIEALASSTPVVVTRTGAAGVVVRHERTGLVVPRGDATALGNAISRLLRRPAFAASLGVRGRALVRRDFSGPLLVERFLRSLVETLERRPVHQTSARATTRLGRLPSPGAAP